MSMTTLEQQRPVAPTTLPTARSAQIALPVAQPINKRVSPPVAPNPVAPPPVTKEDAFLTFLKRNNITDSDGRITANGAALLNYNVKVYGSRAAWDSFWNKAAPFVREGLKDYQHRLDNGLKPVRLGSRDKAVIFINLAMLRFQTHGIIEKSSRIDAPRMNVDVVKGARIDDTLFNRFAQNLLNNPNGPGGAGGVQGLVTKVSDRSIRYGAPELKPTGKVDKATVKLLLDHVFERPKAPPVPSLKP